MIRIPFHVGEDRSRTWVLSRTAEGLRLKHDHRHEDGTPDEITLIPAAATNVWTVEVGPGDRFVYALRREGTDRRFRIVFDLTGPVEPPPAPWGR